MLAFIARNCTLYMYINKSHGAVVHWCNIAETGLRRAPPEFWHGLGGEELRGPSSAAVSAGAADTAVVAASVAAAVEMVMAPPVPGVQKPLRWEGQWFRDRFTVAAPWLKAEKPRGVKTTPAWPQWSRLGACPQVGRDGLDWPLRSCLGACPAVSHDSAGCRARRSRAYKPLGG
jgi:hypothetical protein